MRISRKSSLIIFVLLIALAFTSCGNKNRNNNEYIEKEINEILSQTEAIEGWAPSIVKMINTVFHNYVWDFNPYNDSEELYVVTFTGTYSPNPDIANLSQKGSISYLIDIEKARVEIYSDPDGISSTFFIYILR